VILDPGFGQRSSTRRRAKQKRNRSETEATKKRNRSETEAKWKRNISETEAKLKRNRSETGAKQERNRSETEANKKRHRSEIMLSPPVFPRFSQQVINSFFRFAFQNTGVKTGRWKEEEGRGGARIYVL